MNMYKLYRNETLTYVKTLCDMREKWPDNIPSWIDIATITLIAQIPHEIDVEAIQTSLNEGPIIINSCQFKKHDSKFYNQISISYDDEKYGKRKVIKLFPNGKIHVAGCFHLIDCYNIIQMVCKIITRITKLDIQRDNIKYNIAMINTSFSLNYIVNQKTVINTFNKMGDDYKISFHPDRYAGVKIKFKPGTGMKCVTASIFSTGKVLLSGAENLKEVVYAYEIIVNSLYKNRENVKVENVQVPKLNQVFMGYTMETWMKEGTLPHGITSW